MGITTATLHFYGVKKEDLTALLSAEELLRENNAPWLSVLPAGEDTPSNSWRLEKLAKQLTKKDGTSAALLFGYFDDDVFFCRYYQNGKAVARCASNASWSKLGKQLNLLFGDDLPARAFRYASRCSDLTEQLSLLEETVGAALLDDQESEPRTVPRSDNTFRMIKEREAALRKRPNQYVLTELSLQDWPEDLRAQQGLYSFLCPQWRKYNAERFLFGGIKHSIPYHPQFAVYEYHDRETHKDHLLFYHSGTGQVSEQMIPAATPLEPLWMTERGELVYRFFHILQESTGPSDWFRCSGKGFAACLRPDGSERWSFVPALNEHQYLDYIHTSDDGIITLCVSSACDQEQEFDAMLFRIDGETGEILHSRTIPAAEYLVHLVRVDALNGFAYISKSKEIVILDDSLAETVRWSGYRGSPYFDIVGTFLWQQGYRERTLQLYDLRTGELTEICLEVPAFVLSVLPDGRILGVNEKQTLLTVFDPTGRVASRCSVPGHLYSVRSETDLVYVLGNRTPDTHGFIYDELFDADSFQLWRVDPA